MMRLEDVRERLDLIDSELANPSEIEYIIAYKEHLRSLKTAYEKEYIRALMRQPEIELSWRSILKGEKNDYKPRKRTL